MKKISVLIIILSIVCAVLLSGCAEETQNGQTGYIDVTAAEAKELIDNNPELIIIDVSPSYDNGHLPGAVNYYLGNRSLEEKLKKFNFFTIEKDDTNILIYSPDLTLKSYLLDKQNWHFFTGDTDS